MPDPATPTDPNAATPTDPNAAPSADPTLKPETPPSDPTPERPPWLPEKFKTPEDMAKAYSELEAKQSTSKTEETPAPTEAPKAPDLSAYEAEYLRDGKLSDQSYSDLEKAGFPRQLVDNYVKGVSAAAAAEETKLLNSIGGRDKFDTMAEWARANLSADEVKELDASLASSTEDASKALSTLKEKYDASNGIVPKLIEGDTPATQSNGFRSAAEVTAAMRDPRYKADPAYRNDVIRKIKASRKSGVYK